MKLTIVAKGYSEIKLQTASYSFLFILIPVRIAHRKTALIMFWLFNNRW